MSDLRDQTQSAHSTTLVRSSASLFMQHVYLWMTVGLAVTAIAAYFASTSPAVKSFFHGSFISKIFLCVALLGLVIFLNRSIHRLSSAQATGFFLLYAALNDILLGPTVLYYGKASVVQAFIISAGMFGALSLYGTITKKDLSPWGSFLYMGLIGLILAMFANMFIGSSQMDMIINVIGVIVFAGLTAYDTQKLRAMGDDAPLDDTTAIRRGAIMGALTLYLDFINLFLFLLRIFASRD